MPLRTRSLVCSILATAALLSLPLVLSSSRDSGATATRRGLWPQEKAICEQGRLSCNSADDRTTDRDRRRERVVRVR